MINTQQMSTNTEVIMRAKKDYETVLYAWFGLKQKYNLNSREVFDIIFEVRKEREQN